jgi:hemerythrin
MINLFKWDDSLSTGFADVDLQHKKLILIIEDVREALDSDESEYPLRIAKDLKRLTDYTQYHFTEEEKLMRQNGYPDYEAHKLEHDAFVSRVRAQVATLQSPEAGDGFHFYRFLGSWLIAHIAKSDQAWAAFIREKKST